LFQFIQHCNLFLSSPWRRPCSQTRKYCFRCETILLRRTAGFLFGGDVGSWPPERWPSWLQPRQRNQKIL